MVQLQQDRFTQIHDAAEFCVSMVFSYLLNAGKRFPAWLRRTWQQGGHMSELNIKSILTQVEALLAQAGELPTEAAEAVEKLLNVVEALSSNMQALTAEVERLRRDLEKKKKAKTTGEQNQDDKRPKDDSIHSSEKRRTDDKKQRPARDRRSSKDLTVHEEIECPVDPKTLPPDAVRVEDESKIVQDIVIQPCNIRFVRHMSIIRRSRASIFVVPCPSATTWATSGPTCVR